MTRPFTITDVKYIENIETIDGVHRITIEASDPGEVQRAMARHTADVDINGGALEWRGPSRRGLGWVAVGFRYDFGIENTSEDNAAV